MSSDSTFVRIAEPSSASSPSAFEPARDAAPPVVLCGWVAAVEPDTQRFLLRRGEHHVVVQCEPLGPGSAAVRPESAVRVRGRWIANPAQVGGSAALACEELELLGASENIPFVPETRLAASLSTRARYRYLEFRDPAVQRVLRQRHLFVRAVSSYLDGQGFVSVETPILATPSTSGAKEFVVSSARDETIRYALPQSPQVYGHLLVIGGIDAYYQWARCFRDEDLRANRQPEFTQLHVEKAFADEGELKGIIEHALRAGFHAMGVDFPAAVPSIPFDVARRRYGTDKPDLRVVPALRLLPTVVADGPSPDRNVIMVPALPELDGEAVAEIAGSIGPERFRCLGFTDPDVGLAGKRLRPRMSLADVEALVQARPPSEGPAATVWIGAWAEVDDLVRMLYDRLMRPVSPRSGLCPVWVEGFPLFVEDPDHKGQLLAFGHPFTAPARPQELLATARHRDLLHLKGRAFDLVINGEEIGSGSILIHDYDLQRSVLDRLGLSRKEIRDRYGYLLDALRFGAPPLGGFGLGLDRLMALVLGVDKIREVMAFPKTKQGYCPVTRMGP